jgi:hypothetical protein
MSIYPRSIAQFIVVVLVAAASLSSCAWFFHPHRSVTSIAVSGAGGAVAISERGGSLQMEAVVLPAEASDKSGR